MPEKETPAQRVSALRYPDHGFMAAALDDGEVKSLLGAGRGKVVFSACEFGRIVRLRLPGCLNAVERFFDWTASKSSKHGAQLGRLKPAAEIGKVVGKNHPCRARIRHLCALSRKNLVPQQGSFHIDFPEYYSTRSRRLGTDLE